MSLNTQKQQLVYDLFLEKIRQDNFMKSVKGLHVDEQDIKHFQAKYDICKELVESLNL